MGYIILIWSHLKSHIVNIKLPSFAMDTAHNFGPEFRSEKPVRVLHENKISRIFFPPPSQRFDRQLRR